MPTLQLPISKDVRLHFTFLEVVLLLPVVHHQSGYLLVHFVGNPAEFVS